MKKDGLVGCSNTHRLCAERRLLDEYVADARRHGVPGHKTAAWIRRKNGNKITVVRWKMDGTLGCSVPCVFCRRELARFDMRVRCVTADGMYWFDGHVTAADAPVSKLTSFQKRNTLQ